MLFSAPFFMCPLDNSVVESHSHWWVLNAKFWIEDALSRRPQTGWDPVMRHLTEPSDISISVYLFLFCFFFPLFYLLPFVSVGERPFKCPIEGCGRSFTTSNIRKVHIRTHTGERPYYCTEPGCGRAFASATNYKNHVRIHTGNDCPCLALSFKASAILFLPAHLMRRG